MNLSKLRVLHVIIIGSVLCIIAGVAMFFLVIKPQQLAYKAAEAKYQAAVQLGNQASYNQAVVDLNDAYAKVASIQQQLDTKMGQYMPNLDFGERMSGMISLWREQISTLGPLLNSFARDKAVTVNSANFSVSPPPTNPNDPIFDQDMLIFPLGNVQVQGDFKSLMSNIKRWNNCRRLVMVGPPALSGTSPQLVASYNLVCYVFPVRKGGEKIPMAGAGTGSPGAPAGAGMSPGMSTGTSSSMLPTSSSTPPPIPGRTP